MDENEFVEKIVELIFKFYLEVTEEMTRPNSSFPACLLTRNFLTNINKVLYVRHLIASQKWSSYLSDFDECLKRSEIYFMRSLGICYRDHKSHQNVFESFISVCGFVIFFSSEVHRFTGVNVWTFNYDIVMEFYNIVLKKTFIRRGGFRRLLEHINQSKYLSWNLSGIELNCFDVLVPTDANIIYKLNKEIAKERHTLKVTTIKMPELRETLKAILRNIQSILTSKLTSRPLSHHSSENSEDFRETSKTITKEQERTEATAKLECLDDQDYSKRGCILKPLKDIEEYENIVQEVKRYNLESSDYDYSDNPILNKAANILKHLKNAVESLIEILNEYDKE